MSIHKSYDYLIGLVITNKLKLIYIVSDTNIILIGLTNNY